MIHYHGGPITPESAAIATWSQRHAFVSYAYPDQLPVALQFARTVGFDNSAFTLWKRGGKADWLGYYAWVEGIKRHPKFDFALIPDVIDGDEGTNDALISEWPHGGAGVPVWHLHESIGRLVRLCQSWRTVALGSSGEYSTIGTGRWWGRMAEAMDAACVNGQPIARLHGLRMLDPQVFKHFPFASADSTNIARNIGIDQHWPDRFKRLSKPARAVVMRELIDPYDSAPEWLGLEKQNGLFGELTA